MRTVIKLTSKPTIFSMAVPLLTTKYSVSARRKTVGEIPGMLKFIHLTDPHLTLPGKPLYGLDPEARFRSAIAHIRRHDSDAAFMVVTGDLTHWGEEQAYAILRDGLGDLPFPVHLIIGNHDEREAFQTAFPGIAGDENGFVQYRVDTECGPFLFLDTVQAGTHAGFYCRERLDWLVRQLSLAEDPVCLFMHHPPFPVHLPRLDRIAIVQADAVGKAIRDSGKVRHIFFGHVHRPISGCWHGIPFTTLYATNHQVPLEFSVDAPPPDAPEFTYEAPAYNVVFMDAAQTTVHSCSYDFAGGSISFAESADTDHAKRAAGEAMTEAGSAPDAP